MPGKQVKNWGVYHGVRRSGASKETAARVANSRGSRKKSKSKK
jgi:hypothetical protein